MQLLPHSFFPRIFIAHYFGRRFYGQYDALHDFLLLTILKAKSYKRCERTDFINYPSVYYKQGTYGDQDDPHLKVLQAAHISDDEYFSHMVRDDLNLIIRDIREAHKKDSESAPQTTVADELKENLEAVENFKGSRDEKLVVLYCKQLGINYKNLSDEEFRWLIRILKKSKKMGTPISQRKKR